MANGFGTACSRNAVWMAVCGVAIRATNSTPAAASPVQIGGKAYKRAPHPPLLNYLIYNATYPHALGTILGFRHQPADIIG